MSLARAVVGPPGAVARSPRPDPESGFLVPVVEAAPWCDVLSRYEPECFVVFGIAADAGGDVYVTDASRVRRFDAAGGQVTFIAGRGDPGTCSGGDG